MPLGTANDFARAAGVPLEPALALDLLEAAPHAIDLGEVGGQVFLNMATGGFGSQVTANTSEDLKKVLGGAAYLFTGLSRFSELHAAYGELQGPDFHWRGELLALGIGNGRQAGGGHVLCPEALADDGLLDISILPAPQEVVGTLKNLLADGFGIDNMFVRARLPWVEIKVSEGLHINLDGEPLEGDNLRFTARAAALRVHLPENSPLLSASRSANRPG
jgi:lipid kinase YegS